MTRKEIAALKAARRARREEAKRPIAHPTDPSALLIRLSRGRFAVIDREDAEFICRWKWYLCPARNTPFATAHAIRKRLSGESGPGSIQLHRVLWEHWGLPFAEEIDHRDMDGLNCRRANLRAASPAQNRQNRRKRSDGKSSQHKGVMFYPRYGKWLARITFEKRRRCLGYFTSQDAAARAYAEAALSLHGEFARTE